MTTWTMVGHSRPCRGTGQGQKRRELLWSSGHSRRWSPKKMANMALVQGNPWNQKWGLAIAGTLQRGVGQSGTALDVHGSGGKISYPRRAGICSEVELGSILHRRWYNWVTGYGMDSGAPQHTYWEDISACMETTQGTYPDIQGENTTIKRWYHH